MRLNQHFHHRLFRPLLPRQHRRGSMLVPVFKAHLQLPRRTAQ